MLQWILAIFALCFLLERVRPGWRLPKVPTWAVRVLLVNAVQLAVVLLAGVTWEHWMAGRALIQGLRDVPPIAGGLLAYFIATFAFYWWHRWRHEVHFLWLGFHQIHHSPRRLEVITSFYKHPAEMIVNSLLGSAIVYLLLGLSLEAGAIYTACTAIGEFFYHTNVTTPRWVGYLFQRPEMHRIHHQHGHHQNNYGDIVWWDMIFGTYENPPTWDDACGFGPAEEEALGKMLAWRDVNTET